MKELSYTGAIQILLTRLSSRIEMLNDMETQAQALRNCGIIKHYYLYLQYPNDINLFLKKSGVTADSETEYLSRLFYDLVKKTSIEDMSDLIIDCIQELDTYITNRRIKLR